MRRLLVLALVLLPVTAQAQMTPLFASDIRAATDTLWGFSNNDQGFFTDAWTVTRVTGPAGGNTDDAIRIVGIATDRDEQDGSHLYTSMPEATVAQGATRYFRMRIKVNSPIRWPSNVSGTNANSSGGKVALLGNGCGLSGDRVIFTIFDPGDSNRDGPVALRIDKGVSTEADIDTFLTPDQWESFQFQMTGGTTAVSTDAIYRVWKNTDVQGSPTATATGFAWNNTGLGQTSTGGSGCQLQWGVDAFNHLADDTFADANFSIEIADLEYDDEFDPNWYSGGGATYYRFRFRSSVEPTPWGLVAWTDRRRRGGDGVTVRSPGVITPDALGLLMVGSLSFVATTHLLQQPPSAPPLDLRMWVEVAFYVLSTAGCGAFFTWIVKRLDRLRAHEHRQNNHMARLVLESEQHADDLAAIRKALRIPR